MKIWIKFGTIGAAGLLAGSGIATAIILPIVFKKTNALINALSQFIPPSGPSPMKNWNSSTKLNLVALGDSETSGHDEFLAQTSAQSPLSSYRGNDYLSYADFLANDLRQSKHLNSYKNFAVSGAKIGNTHELINNTPAIQSALSKANLITLTLGANNLLSFVKLLDMPFSAIGGGNGMLGLFNGNDVKANEFRAAIFDKFGGQKTSAGVGPEVFGKSIVDSFHSLQFMMKTGDYTNIMTIQKELKDKIFDIIKRDMAFFIHDLHSIAPNAQILVLGHIMPFEQWPKAILNAKHPELNNSSIIKEFQRFLNSVRDGVKSTISGSDDYVTYKSINNLKVYKSSDLVGERRDGLPSRDGANKTFADYVRHIDDVQKDTSGAWVTNKNFYIRNAADNAEDIHPSTFGYELIGNSVYSLISGNLAISNPINTYTYSTQVEYLKGPINPTIDLGKSNAKNWTRMDEDFGKYIVNTNNNTKLYKLDINRSTSQKFSDFLNSNGHDRNNQYATRSIIYKTLNNEAYGFKPIEILSDIKDWSFITNSLYDQTQFNFLKKVITDIFDGISGDISKLKDAIKTFISLCENQKKNSNETTINKILDNFSKLGSSITVNNNETKDFKAIISWITSLINLLRVSQSNNIPNNLSNLNKQFNSLHSWLLKLELIPDDKLIAANIKLIKFMFSDIEASNQQEKIKFLNSVL